MSATLEIAPPPAAAAPERLKIPLAVTTRLTELIDVMAKNYSQSTGADPPPFYKAYYLGFRPHLTVLYPIGQHLGITRDSRVLEVGSGIGTRCMLGAGSWGAQFVGLEPCVNTYTPLRDAIAEFKRANPHLPYSSVARPGEEMGLDSESFDTILSFEVMEHVRDPRSVIREMHRVLKPGGRLFLTTCNYASFYEGHFRCLWMPFLNRRSGGMWARLRGRNPAFLDEVNFITRYSLLRELTDAGFIDITLSPQIAQARLPYLDVQLPEGFSTDFPGRRRSFFQEVTQKPRVHRLLSKFGLEYKIVLQARKY
jgi:SAM-dependent methyltransferase